ncbi:MAG: DUF11 domain-containing protein [Anaerolineae bacterium]|nr:DUF11 domain-containing protein [Anaerolineae bacterium]
MKLKHMGFVALVALMGCVFVGIAPLHAHSDENLSDLPFADLFASALDLDIDVTGELAPGVLGLPGEPVSWVITVKNAGQAAGKELVIADTVHEALRIDSTQATHGTVQVDAQVVTFSIPVLNPGETAELTINTTVLGSPVNGKLVNQAVLTVSGPDGTVARHVSAEVFVPTGLPATGYAPPNNDLPGEGEPSVWVFGLGAVGMVSLVAAFVWYRGRQRF